MVPHLGRCSHWWEQKWGAGWGSSAVRLREPVQRQSGLLQKLGVAVPCPGLCKVPPAPEYTEQPRKSDTADWQGCWWGKGAACWFAGPTPPYLPPQDGGGGVRAGNPRLCWILFPPPLQVGPSWPVFLIFSHWLSPPPPETTPQAIPSSFLEGSGGFPFFSTREGQPT